MKKIKIYGSKFSPIVGIIMFFAFMTGCMFSMYQSGGKSLLRIFPDKEKGLGQRAIYNELQAVKSFRNRIAHYEAICFDSMGSKSTSIVRDNYAIIVKYIQFLGFSESSLFYGLDVIPHKLLNKIDLL